MTSESEAKGRTDRGSRIVRARVDAVYRAFTDGEAVMAWLPPEGMRGELLAFDPRADGAFRMRLTYADGGAAMAGKSSGDSDLVEGRFVEFVQDRRIVQEGIFDSPDPAFAGIMRMTWEFEPVEEGTRVTVTAENVPQGIRQEDHELGMASSLAQLAAFVE